MKLTTYDLVLCALCAAVTCILAPLSVPLAGEVPVSLATFAVLLSGILLGAKLGGLSQLIYVLLGRLDRRHRHHPGRHRRIHHRLHPYGIYCRADLPQIRKKRFRRPQIHSYVHRYDHFHRSPLHFRNCVVHGPDRNDPGRLYGSLCHTLPARRSHQDRRRHACGSANRSGTQESRPCRSGRRIMIICRRLRNRA